ncbi:MAG: M48 family metalloprotease [Saprospiraceae bacterium]|nr:M48 family metalloprotease [Saprospiraceae bacterium]
MLRLSVLLKSAFTAILMLTAFSCSVNPVTGKKEIMLMTKDQEIALGIQSNPEVLATFGAYQDETLQNFINQKGQEMAKVSHRPELEYKFQILDSPVVNAFALPGGFVYFTRGIMAHFNNEAEFAGVLGHEIGHVTARHGAQQYTQQILLQGALLVGVVASEDFAQYAGLASQGLGLLMLKFGRDDESQSDQLGVQYSTKIGYDAHEMAHFFKTIDRLSGGDNGGVPTFLSTHPNPIDRYNKVNQLATDAQKTSPAANLQVNRDQYLRMIDGLIYGDDPRQGYLENNIFYHPDLKFQFPVPQGWQFQNMPAQVQMAPQDGKSLVVFTLAQGNSINEAANVMAQDTSLKVESRQNATVNGLPAMIIVGNQQAQDGKVVSSLIYLIQYNNLIYKFIGMAYAQDFSTYRPVFENTMKNFKQLNDQSKINVQPERIRIKTVAQNGTLEATLRGFGIEEKRLSELAILNGMELKDPVTKGTLIKVLGK